MKPELKNENKKVKKPSLFGRIRSIFIPKDTPQTEPTAVKLVENMTEKNYYPAGKNIDYIAKKIVNRKDLPYSQKMELLFDAFGKYYKYQHKSAMLYAIDESSAEFSRIEDEYARMGKKLSFNDYFDSRMKEGEYIVNRQLRDSVKALQEKSVENLIINRVFEPESPLTEKLIEVVSTELKDDFWNKQGQKGYEMTSLEKSLRPALVHRYEMRELSKKEENTPKAPSAPSSQDPEQGL